MHITSFQNFGIGLMAMPPAHFLGNFKRLWHKVMKIGPRFGDLFAYLIGTQYGIMTLKEYQVGRVIFSSMDIRP